MKKLIIAAAFLMTTVFASAQKLTAAKVPSEVKTAFSKSHPSVTPKWEKEDGNYEASFKQDGHDMSCIINNSGAILETETDIAVSALPKTVQDYIKTHYKGQKIKEASKIVKQGGEVNYEALVNGRDIMFDVNGKFLKEIQEEND